MFVAGKCPCAVQSLSNKLLYDQWGYVDDALGKPTTRFMQHHNGLCKRLKLHFCDGRSAQSAAHFPVSAAPAYTQCTSANVTVE
jgi:hypothetical protein